MANPNSLLLITFSTYVFKTASSFGLSPLPIAISLSRFNSSSPIVFVLYLIFSANFSISALDGLFLFTKSIMSCPFCHAVNIDPNPFEEVSSTNSATKISLSSIPVKLDLALSCFNLFNNIFW